MFLKFSVTLGLISNYYQGKSCYKFLIYEGRTESHEQLFACQLGTVDEGECVVVDGTSCCVIPECLVTSIACIT